MFPMMVPVSVTSGISGGGGAADFVVVMALFTDDAIHIHLYSLRCNTCIKVCFILFHIAYVSEELFVTDVMSIFMMLHKAYPLIELSHVAGALLSAHI